MIEQLELNGKKSDELDSPQSFFKDIEVEFLVHELKDPLAVIETGIRTLLERTEKCGPLSPIQVKTLNRILRNARKARTMLYDMLEVGRSEEGAFVCGRFNPVASMYDLLADVLESSTLDISDDLRSCREENTALALLNQEGIFVFVESQVADMQMYQDEIKFRKIVGNLIKNALHHRKQRMEINIKRDEDNLLVEIKDDGPGVDPEHHQMIFRRYAQAKECTTVERTGHGLGLAGGLIIARCLGGDIELESKKGKGATFRLFVPIHMDEI